MKTFIVVDDRSTTQALEFIAGLDREHAYSVDVKVYKTSRTLAQNSLYWMWMTEMRDHLLETTGESYSAEDLHDFMKGKFLPTKVTEILGEIHRTKMSTTRLKVDEFSQYLEKIDYYCADELHLNLTHPDDVYDRAMGE